MASFVEGRVSSVTERPKLGGRPDQSPETGRWFASSGDPARGVKSPVNVS
jgi:hypothetical protein